MNLLETELISSVLDRERIHLLTQNMFMLPGLPEFGKKLYKNERMAFFVKNILKNFDIVCL